jgi:hypothetical protein
MKRLVDLAEALGGEPGELLPPVAGYDRGGRSGEPAGRTL